jgi:hypothetical protein
MTEHIIRFINFVVVRFVFRSVSHDECQWNYMTYGIAGSSPVAPIRQGKGRRSIGRAHKMFHYNLVVV